MPLSKIDSDSLNTPITAADLAYTGTLTGSTGIVNIGSGQVYKDASGNVGIGTSSITNPQGWGKVLQITNSGSSALYLNDGTANLSIAAYSGRFYFTNGAATQMVLDPSGNLLVGTTSQINTGLICSQGNLNSVNTLVCKNTVAQGSGQSFAFFANSAGNKAGSIDHTGTTTVAYTTSSDYRMKENIAPMTGALIAVSQLKPCTYTWKEDGKAGQGFIAHELQSVVPDCVSGDKDAVETYTDEDGNEATRPVYQGIDTSFLVATLTAAIQELKAIVDAQGAEIAALKGTP